MPDNNSTTIPGYDPRTDPDSEHYDPDYDPEADPWNDPDYDPFAEDYDPETGEKYPDESPLPEGEKECIPQDCELVEVEDGFCCFACRETCSDGSGITGFYCEKCNDASE
jgi:hypothetical protein